MIPRHHDTTVSRNHDTAMPSEDPHIFELVRKSVKHIGKEAATHCFTLEEKTAYVAQFLLDELGDQQSEKFYRLVAAKIPEAVIREALSAIRVDGAEHPAKLFTFKMQRYALGSSGVDSRTKTFGVSRKRGKVTAYT